METCIRRLLGFVSCTLAILRPPPLGVRAADHGICAQGHFCAQIPVYWDLKASGFAHKFPGVPTREGGGAHIFLGVQTGKARCVHKLPATTELRPCNHNPLRPSVSSGTHEPYHWLRTHRRHPGPKPLGVGRVHPIDNTPTGHPYPYMGHPCVAAARVLKSNGLTGLAFNCGPPLVYHFRVCHKNKTRGWGQS